MPDLEALFADAIRAYESGRPQEAETKAKQIVQQDPQNVRARVLLGELCARTGRLAPAIDWLKQALAIDREAYGAMMGLANLYASSGRMPEAVAMLERAIRTRPEISVAYGMLGSILQSQGRMNDAIAYLRQAAEREPAAATPYRTLGLAYYQAGKLSEAEAAFREAVVRAPDEATPYSDLGQVLYTRQAYSEAAVEFRKALERAPGNVRDTVLLGQVLFEAGELDEAEALFRQAIVADPKHITAQSFLGSLLKQQGRFAEALPYLNRNIELQSQRGGAFLDLVNGKRIGAEDRPLVERMELLVRTNMPPQERQALHYALGKALDDLGDYGQAIRHFDEANAIARKAIEAAGQKFNRGAISRRIDEIIARYPPSAFANLTPNEDDVPIFIVGMVRSGTTLVEQIISSHPKVAAAGELPFWTERAQAIDREEKDATKAIAQMRSEYLDVLRKIAPSALHVTDKMPGNFVALGLMHIAFPGSRMIACRRNGADNALSIYTTAFRTSHTYVHDREDIVFFFREFSRLLDHWRSVLPTERYMEISYEELVRDRETVTRGMLDFCGLEWDAACMSPEANDRPVKTPSQWQVRQPVYTTSVERWRNYEPWLGAFRQLLD